MFALIFSAVVVILSAGTSLYIYFHNHNHENPHKRFKPSRFNVGTLNFWALGDRVLIEEDEFKSGYECTKCGGLGKVDCDNCSGTMLTSTGKKCSICSDGKLTCDLCNGKGGLLIAPETTQRRPTSGKVVSVGYAVEVLKPGDSVLYSNFAGYVVDLARAGKTVPMRILHESEILCGMDGHLTLSNLKGKSELATFNS